MKYYMIREGIRTVLYMVYVVKLNCLFVVLNQDTIIQLLESLFEEYPELQHGSCIEVAHKLVLDLNNHHQETAKHSVNAFQLFQRIVFNVFENPDNMINNYGFFLLGILLHDIGKLFVPSEVLNKPDLTKAEYSLLHKHDELGAKLLRSNFLSFPEVLSYPALYHHHISNAPKSKQSLIFLVSLCDQYDALTTPRAYRNGRSFSSKTAFQIISKQLVREYKIYNKIFYRFVDVISDLKISVALKVHI